MAPARRARTRKTAWNASSAAWRISEQMATDAEHHRSVPCHQERKGCLSVSVSIRRKSFEQLGVRHPDH